MNQNRRSFIFSTLATFLTLFLAKWEAFFGAPKPQYVMGVDWGWPEGSWATIQIAPALSIQEVRQRRYGK